MAFEKTKIIGVAAGAAGATGVVETIKHLGVEVGVHAVAGAGLEFVKHLIKL